MKTFLPVLKVRAPLGRAARGCVIAGIARFPCALGPGGITVAKREGDGRTPRGVFAFRRLWRRADRTSRPATGVPVRATRPDDGWCDAAGHRRYNRPIKLPFAASHETMWRDDYLYDLVFEIGWNDRPVRAGRGSAIFLHAARPGSTPTAGCVALTPAVLKRLAGRIGPRTRIEIGRPVSRPRRNVI